MTSTINTSYLKGKHTHKNHKILYPPTADFTRKQLFPKTKFIQNNSNTEICAHFSSENDDDTGDFIHKITVQTLGSLLKGTQQRGAEIIHICPDFRTLF